MPPTVAAARRQPPVQSLDLPLIGATPDRQATVNPVDGDWILPLVARAIEATSSRKTAALTMGLDAAQMTRQLQADGHLSIRRLGLMGDDFWLALIDELRTHFRLDSDGERLDRALDGIQAALNVVGQIARKAVSR